MLLHLTGLSSRWSAISSLPHLNFLLGGGGGKGPVAPNPPSIRCKNAP